MEQPNKSGWSGRNYYAAYGNNEAIASFIVGILSCIFSFGSMYMFVSFFQRGAVGETFMYLFFALAVILRFITIVCGIIAIVKLIIAVAHKGFPVKTLVFGLLGNCFFFQSLIVLLSTFVYFSSNG